MIPPALQAAELDQIRTHILDEYADLFQPVPPVLPPFREINHSIPLVDERKRYNYHLPRRPEALRTQLSDKIERYVQAGWWVPRAVDQAAPLLCVYKKDGRLRTVVDLRQRNDNTVRDVTPFPDQDQIRNDVARARYRTKLDMSDAYEQTRIAEEDVPKTAFATIFGTFVSRVMQQGDCNAPSTFQRLMTQIFRERIGRTIHVYLDDIFIFTNTLEEHIENIRWVFAKLREHRLYLSAKKVDILSSSMDCLGHLIDDRGLHADSDKMVRIRDWPVPKNWHDVQQFLGLVQYLAHFMPDVTAYTGPLSAMTKNGQSFFWRPLHQKCFDEIKRLACKSPILRPIDPGHPDPIWLVTDASHVGVGAMYGQGPSWESCRPAGFMSKKFTSAQFSYFTSEQEALAVVEALLKWEDKLMGRPFTIVTDHKSLSFMNEKRHLVPRIQQWMEYISRFDYKILWVQGVSNKVADALSRYYLSEEASASHPPYDLVTADARLDPDGDTLGANRVLELRATRVEDRREPRDVEAADLAQHAPGTGAPPDAPTDDPTAVESTGQGPPLDEILHSQLDVRALVKDAYGDDVFFRKILDDPTHFALFRVHEGLVWHRTPDHGWVLCVPQVRHAGRRVTELITSQAHDVLGHLGHRRTSDYIRRWYWWPRMGRLIEVFCRSCGTCQTVKASTQRPAGLLHNLPIPDQPWDSISMDFVGPFPECDGYDYLWVIIDRFSVTVHLIPTTTTVRASQLAWLFVREVVRLHGLPSSIVSDRDSKFVSKFWREVHRLLGTKLLMSTSYHPETDGTSERAIRTATQILRALVRPDQKDWARRTPMVEFAMNSSRNATTGFAPFEITGGTLPRMLHDIAPEPALPGVTEFAERALDHLRQAHDNIIASRVEQTRQANRRRRDEEVGERVAFAVGAKAYLSTANLNMPKGRAHKLLPKFIGPYEIVRAHPATSNYTLKLPPALAQRGIHPTFHVSRLRPHEPNDETLFPHREAEAFYDFGDDPDREYLVDDILAHQWRGNAVSFLVQWTAGDATWEPWSHVKDLAAVDRYFELLGVREWHELPRARERQGPRADARATTRQPEGGPTAMTEAAVPTTTSQRPHSGGRDSNMGALPTHQLAAPRAATTAPTAVAAPPAMSPQANARDRPQAQALDPGIRRTARAHKPRVRTS